MSSWKVAPSLVQLLSQLNAKYPTRNKAWDGTIGDTAHSERKSDHNVDSDGVVRALDVTNDPKSGLVAENLAEHLRKKRDPRVRYIISNRKIAEAKNNFEWHPYGGANPHDHHVHISVQGPPQRDDARMWDLQELLSATSNQVANYIPPPPLLKVGSRGSNVMEVQSILKLPADGFFGPRTKAAVQEFQNAHGLLSDGIVGPSTWALLKGTK